MNRRKTCLFLALTCLLISRPSAFLGQDAPRVIVLKQGLAGENRIEIDRGAEAGVKLNMKGHVYFIEGGDRIKIAFFVITRVDPLVSEARITSFTEPVRVGHFLSFDEPLVPPPPSGFLDISTTADPATFFVDGQRIGTTPARVPFNPGTYKLRIAKEGFRDHEETITVAAGQDTRIPAKLAQVPDKVYKVRINSFPEQGRVFIDGTDRGPTPLDLDLTKRSYRVRVEKQGYKPREEILIVAGDIPEKSYVLEKLGHGEIVLDAYPPAELEIDGVRYGEIPPALKLSLPEGPHKIRLFYFRQNQTREHTINVIKDQTETKHFRLDAARGESGPAYLGGVSSRIP